jgi:crotonobetainyl-CoA:carnitine CoA-transferase CaiB-like acyl-CoA transferase
VVDCSVHLAGARATGLLAAYGADVLWIEPAGGSLLRAQSPEAAPVFNRYKRSVVLEHGDELRRLIARADVFLGPAPVEARPPGLVTCAISGFGADGPHRDVAGRDALVHALVGTMGE